MPSLSTRFSVAALTLLVTVAACAEKATQPGQAETDYAALWRQSDGSAANAKPPVLEIKALDGKASVFLHGGPPPAPGLFQYVEVSGSGFPPGAQSVSRTYGVRADGSRFNVSTGIGIIPEDGTVAGTYGSSCPSYFVEFYEVVFAGGVTTESKHVAPAC